MFLGILGSLSIRAVLSPIARACVFWSRNTDYTHTCGNWFVVQLASEDNAVPKFDVAGLIFTAQYGLDRALARRFSHLAHSVSYQITPNWLCGRTTAHTYSKPGPNCEYSISCSSSSYFYRILILAKCALFCKVQ